MSFGKCHVALENMQVIFKYLLILISNNFTLMKSMISIPLDHEILHFVLCPWICSSVSWFIVYGSLNRICILLLCESCINFTYVELVHSAFQVYYIFLLFCLFILIFKSLIVKVAHVRLFATS